METRKKILQTALKLFNKDGLQHHTVRTIAAEMHISHGNLCYHFLNKWNIVEALFTDMMEGFEKIRPSGSSISLSTIFDLQMRYFQTQVRYQFIFESLTEIFERLPAVHHSFSRYQNEKNEMMKMALQQLIESDFIQALTSRQVDQLLSTQQIFSNFWSIDARYFFQGLKSAKTRHYHYINCNLIVPYLTPKGEREFRKYFAIK